MRQLCRTRSSAGPRGFTLVEIIVVVAVLAILAAVTVPQFSPATVDARNASVLHDNDLVRSAVRLYRQDHNGRDPDLRAGWSPLTTASDANGQMTGALLGPYLVTTPVNPFTGNSTLSVGSSSSSGDWIWDPATDTLTPTDGRGNKLEAAP